MGSRQVERVEGRTFLGAADPEGAEGGKFGRTPLVELDAPKGSPSGAPLPGVTT